MFKRLWESLNYWAEALAMDDPRGTTCSGWKIASQSLSAKSKVSGSRRERRGSGRRMTAFVNCNRERRKFGEGDCRQLVLSTCRASKVVRRYRKLLGFRHRAITSSSQPATRYLERTR
jgi:hypothetical protein